MKRWFFLAALCLLTLSVSYADNGLPHQWNYGDAVYGHETQWNFDAVVDQIASLSDVSTLTARVASCETNISDLQAADATHTANILSNTLAIATHTAQIASLSVNDGTIQKLVIASQAASVSIPFAWSDTSGNFFQLVDGDVLRFRFDYSCHGLVSGEKKWGTIDGCVSYTSASGTSFIPSSSSLVTLDSYTTGASSWSVIASCSSGQLSFIASFPVSVRAFGTCTITGK